MSTYFIVINALLAAFVVGSVAGLLLWAIVTQHRDPACTQIRLLRGRLAARRTRLGRQVERPAQEVVLG
jgi:hypothetical protein